MQISDNITTTKRKKSWRCDCGATGIVNECTQALICGSCKGVVNKFTLVEILTEPTPSSGNKLSE